MRRRELIALVGGMAAWPLVARAQPADRLRRVIVLTNVNESDLDEQSRVIAFRRELLQLGWIEGSNLQLDHRWSSARTDLARKFAAEIVGMKPDVIFVVGTTTVSIMLKQTRTIPVIFVTSADPVQVGFVKSLARPGGNATGVADLEDTVGAKWLQLLKEIAPSTNRVIFLHSESRASLIQLPTLQQSAAGMGITILPARVSNAAEIDKAISSHAKEGRVGLIVPPSSVMAVHRSLIFARVAEYSIPAIYPNRRFTVDGGLMSYGIDRIEQYKRAASYVDRILKGAQPADLPVRQSEKFEFVLNLKTARAFGLDIPRMLLAAADEVIE